MEKFFAFTPLPASFKRTVSMVLWSLSILVVLTVIGYFIYQWNSSKNTKEKMKDQGTFIAEQGLVINAIKKNTELNEKVTEVLIKDQKDLNTKHQDIKSLEELKTEEVLSTYDKTIEQTTDPKLKETLTEERNRALSEVKIEALWAKYCATPGADTNFKECEVQQ